MDVNVSVYIRNIGLAKIEEDRVTKMLDMHILEGTPMLELAPWAY